MSVRAISLLVGISGSDCHWPGLLVVIFSCASAYCRIPKLSLVRYPLLGIVSEGVDELLKFDLNRSGKLELKVSWSAVEEEEVSMAT
jgi:hypothetical protein